MAKTLHNFAMFCIVNLVQKYMLRKKKRRPSLKSIEHYTSVIFQVLRTGMQWNELKEDCHYTTYHKKFVEWSNAGIFSLAHKITVKHARVNELITDEDLNTLSIDTSMIKNNRGVDEIGPNHYDRFRNATKVSVVVSQQGIPLGLSFNGANVHDIKMVFDTIDDVQIKIAGSSTLADKGYNSIKLKTEMKEKYAPPSTLKAWRRALRKV